MEDPGHPKGTPHAEVWGGSPQIHTQPGWPPSCRIHFPRERRRVGDLGEFTQPLNAFCVHITHVCRVFILCQALS